MTRLANKKQCAGGALALVLRDSSQVGADSTAPDLRQLSTGSRHAGAPTCLHGARALPAGALRLRLLRGLGRRDRARR